MTRVRVGNVTFFGSKAETAAGGVASGFVITQNGLTGWDDGTNIRRNTVYREQAHGEFDVPGFQSGRVVSVAGICYATSAQQMRYYKAVLGGLLADGGSAQIIFDQVDATTWGFGHLTGQTRFTPVLPASLSNYQIQFWFPDPRRYGPSNTFGPASSVTAVHYGNFTAAPVLTVAGSMPSGYTVAGPAGKVFTVTAAVVSGSPHTIDMATGYLTIGGVIQTGVVTVANTWGVPPGQTVTMTLTPVSGSGTLTAAVKDTSI